MLSFKTFFVALMVTSVSAFTAPPDKKADESDAKVKPAGVAGKAGDVVVEYMLTHDIYEIGGIHTAFWTTCMRTQGKLHPKFQAALKELDEYQKTKADEIKKDREGNSETFDAKALETTCDALELKGEIDDNCTDLAKAMKDHMEKQFSKDNKKDDGCGSCCITMIIIGSLVGIAVIVAVVMMFCKSGNNDDDDDDDM